MIRTISALSLAGLLGFAGHAQAQMLPQTEAQVSVCFTPAQSCVGQIIAAIDAAKSEIRVQAFSFTAHPILAALVRAHGRGVDVAVLVDRSAQRAAAQLDLEGVPVAIDFQPQEAHAKVIVIDRRLVLAGSCNWSQAAEYRNSEDLMFITSPAIAAQFLANWERRRAVSRPVGE
jgi:phosphatidylserine/phosphatidylglycerophosphate/cardiolipin synthase-like enzyme